jgi:hypothetical protein
MAVTAGGRLGREHYRRVLAGCSSASAEVNAVLSMIEDSKSSDYPPRLRSPNPPRSAHSSRTTAQSTGSRLNRRGRQGNRRESVSHFD